MSSTLRAAAAAVAQTHTEDARTQTARQDRRRTRRHGERGRANERRKKKHTRHAPSRLAELGDDELGAPDLLLGAQAILAAQLQLLVDAFLLEGATRRLSRLGVCARAAAAAAAWRFLRARFLQCWQSATNDETSARTRAQRARQPPRALRAFAIGFHSQLRKLAMFGIAKNDTLLRENANRTTAAVTGVKTNVVLDVQQ